MTIIKSTIATVQQGVARADGKLVLTGDEVRFTPFNQQLGLGPYVFKPEQISTVTRCLGKGGGIIPITTDAIRVTLVDQQVYEFIVAEPDSWITALV
ncbi:hypothetical protein [Motilimonas eburnea]|uniref:hypothetical protein n=1 Tax=Motilimonas eburnea TaxID=1737488 RepID=UPI001E516E9C|nr:hypothetical protein [Motilimonas eburnea]MCE2572955.1 hypothetical protein [Motilimonas eburnea]